MEPQNPRKRKRQQLDAENEARTPTPRLSLRRLNAGVLQSAGQDPLSRPYTRSQRADRDSQPRPHIRLSLPRRQARAEPLEEVKAPPHGDTHAQPQAEPQP